MSSIRGGDSPTVKEASCRGRLIRHVLDAKERGLLPGREAPAFKWLVSVMREDPELVRHELNTLIRKGEVEEKNGRLGLTSKGRTASRSRKLYGNPGAETIAGVIRLRAWAEREAATRSGRRLSASDAKKEARAGKISGNKVGRILARLGFERKKRGGKRVYAVPSSVPSVPLRDLTRTKRDQISPLGPETFVAATSFQRKSPKPKSEVYRDMQRFVKTKLASLPGVSRPKYLHGSGFTTEWGREPSGSITYFGDGQALKAVARFASDNKQGSAIVATTGGEVSGMRYRDGAVSGFVFGVRLRLPERKNAEKLARSFGVLDGTWSNILGDGTALTLICVPQYGGKPEDHAFASSKIEAELSKKGVSFTPFKTIPAKVIVMEEDSDESAGKMSYREVESGGV